MSIKNSSDTIGNRVKDGRKGESKEVKKEKRIKNRKVIKNVVQ